MTIHNTQKLPFLLREKNLRSMDVALLINSYFSATAIIQNYFVN